MQVPSVCHYTFSTSGGAGRVAEQLSNGLNNFGLESHIKSITAGDIRDCVFTHPVLSSRALIDFYLVRKSRDQHLFTLFREADGVKIEDQPHLIHHLHWTPGVATLSQIGQLIRGKNPTIWTLHDMWPFTGGCHHAMNCEGYTRNCSACPQTRGIYSRLVEQSLNSKKQNFTRSQKFVAITPSNWLKDQAVKSEIFNGCEIKVVSNPIDTERFSPAIGQNRDITDKLVIGCNATNLLDPMKGVSALIEELEKFQHQNPSLKVVLLAIGEGDLSSQLIEIEKTGYLADQQQIASAYSKMDVFISLSKAEVFPLSIAEAQSCGLPVICLNSGGMPEMIRQSINGFVVTQPSDLLHVLGQFIRPETNRKKMQVSARRHALANYSTNVVIKQYIDIYSALISD